MHGGLIVRIWGAGERLQLRKENNYGGLLRQVSDTRLKIKKSEPAEGLAFSVYIKLSANYTVQEKNLTEHTRENKLKYITRNYQIRRNLNCSPHLRNLSG
jgi:hypothetical protein